VDIQDDGNDSPFVPGEPPQNMLSTPLSLPTSLGLEKMVVVVRSESGTCLSARPSGPKTELAPPPVTLLAPPSQAWMATPRCDRSQASTQQVYKPPLHVFVGPSTTAASRKPGAAAATEAKGLQRSRSATRVTPRPDRADHPILGIWDFIHNGDATGSRSQCPDDTAIRNRPGKMFPGRRSTASPKTATVESVRSSARADAADHSCCESLCHSDASHSSRGSALRAARELRSSLNESGSTQSLGPRCPPSASASSSRPAVVSGGRTCPSVPPKVRPSRPNSAVSQLLSAYRAPPAALHRGLSRSQSRGRVCSAGAAARCPRPSFSPKSENGHRSGSHARNIPGPWHGPNQKRGSTSGAATHGGSPKSDSRAAQAPSHPHIDAARGEAYPEEAAATPTVAPHCAPRTRLGAAIAAAARAKGSPGPVCRPRPPSASSARR
jgi:hypothetical protein